MKTINIKNIDLPVSLLNDYPVERISDYELEKIALFYNRIRESIEKDIKMLWDMQKTKEEILLFTRNFYKELRASEIEEIYNEMQVTYQLTKAVGS